MPLNKKAELQTDWIQRLEATEKDPISFSLNELDNATHQQVPAYRIRRQGSKSQWMDDVLNGGTIEGFCRHGHGHSQKQFADLDRAPSSLEYHVKKDHFEGNSDGHREYHKEEDSVI